MNVHPTARRREQPPTRSILGVPVASLDWNEAVDLVQRRIAEEQFTRIAFLNAHSGNFAVSDPSFAAILQDFLVLADGVGVDLASKILHGAPFPANLNGTDFVPGLLAATKGPLTVGLLGARRDRVETAAASLAAMTPQHRIVVVADGYFSAAEETAILDRLAELRPDVLLVAMGVPRQEYWIAAKLDSRHAVVPIAVGALFDFLSGAVPRAPGWMRRLRLEWLFRFYVEPGRLWRRYVVGNPLFLWRVFRQKLFSGQRHAMNSRFVPAEAAAATPMASGPLAAGTAAVVTASYAPDFERCRLLCETMDRHVSGAAHHYLLVEGRDVSLFKALETRRRTVVDERDLLPRWLRPVDDPLSGFRRRLWLSARTMPLRGWHVQQLRRIAIAGHVAEDALVYVDSDVVFLKPFDCGAFWRNGKLRLFRRDDVLLGPHDGDQKTWSRNAGIVLGIVAPPVSPHDYISTLIAWRRQAVLDVCARIEAVQGRNWVAALGARRKFSECMIYGRYVDEVIEGDGHFHGAEEFCRVHWSGQPLSDAEFHAFVDAMTPAQVAIGMQSFIGTDLGRIRRLLDFPEAFQKTVAGRRSAV